jgi:hypothetical protein
VRIEDFYQCLHLALDSAWEAALHEVTGKYDLNKFTM